MTQPAKTAVLTLDYPSRGGPFLAVPAKSVVNTQTLDYPSRALPFVTTPADPTVTAYATPDVRPGRIAFAVRSATAVAKTRGGGGGGTAIGIGIGLPFVGGRATPVPVPPPPSGAYGVPHQIPDTTLSTEAWALAHWANPDGPNHVAYGDILTHTTVVDVSPPDLQTPIANAIAAAPDGKVNTTFRLAAGTYAKCLITGPADGIHVVAADPNNRPVVRGIEVISCPTAYYYLGSLGWNMLVSGNTTTLSGSVAALRAIFLNPPRDYLFRNLDMTSDGTPVTHVSTSRPGASGTETYADRIENLPFYFTGVSDVCVEGCTMRGYVHADGSGAEGAPNFHSGLITATGGVRNHVYRNNTVWGTEPPHAYGFPCAYYNDGPRGCAFVDNDLFGKWQSNVFLVLDNDDFSRDYNLDGIIDPIDDARGGKYNMILGNEAFSQSTVFVQDGGTKNLLVAGNTLHQTGNGLWFAQINPRVGGAITKALGITYLAYDHVYRDNVVTGGGYSIHPFVEMTPDSGVIGGNPNDPLNGRVGRMTVTGNTVSGTILGHNHAAEVNTDWLGDATGSTATSDGPDVISGNSHG